MNAELSLLLADTARSRAYAQTLAHRGVRASRALIVKSPDRFRWGQTHPTDHAACRSSAEGLLLPDLSVPLEDSVAAVTDNLDTAEVGSLNHPQVAHWRSADAARLTVFSGFGGEIVTADTLDAGAPLLHVHSGWLPDYRGSTTIYYSILADRTCGVSAILLGEDIDTGPLVARRRYPLPSPGLDIDYVYDSAIRADLLADVVTAWQANGGRFADLDRQPCDGTTYYIIHPVLKRLALDHVGRK